MVLTDKEKFEDCMIRCFQNYRAAVDGRLLDEWFEELKSFNMFSLEQAFRIYKREHERFPPTLATIIKIAKRTSAEERTNIRDDCPRKCFFTNCFSDDVEYYPTNPDILMCRLHCDEMILKTDPDSIQAEVIRGARRFEAQAKEAGLTNSDYFKKSQPALFNAINKNRQSEKSEVARRAVVNALGNFFATPLPTEERKKILVEMNAVVIEAKLRNDDGVAQTDDLVKDT